MFSIKEESKCCRSMQSYQVCSIYTLLLIICLSFPILINSKLAHADEELHLLSSFSLGSDSTVIVSINPIGDFNADGYEDLLVGVNDRFSYPDSPREYSFLFFGGYQFDSIPDLVFRGAPQNLRYCFQRNERATYFGSSSCKIGDFNADGYDDIAIGAPYYCSCEYYAGAIYIYFGGDNPDTSADLIISGQGYYDNLGSRIQGGDYNNDTYDDVLALARSPVLGSKIQMYLGSQLPDSIPDVVYNYSNQTEIDDVYGNYDINGDSIVDFGWNLFGENLIYFGGDSINLDPNVQFSGSIPFLPGDVSGDGMGDIISNINNAYYLFIGGLSFDTTPDEFMWSSRTFDVFLFPFPNSSIKIVRQDEIQHIFWAYDVGIPFDTIPYTSIHYDHLFTIGNPYIGDINDDQIADLVLVDSNRICLGIYNIEETSIDDSDIDLPSSNNFHLVAYPNPFNNSTIISFNVDNFEEECVILTIFDIGGRVIDKQEYFGNQYKKNSILWHPLINNSTAASSEMFIAQLKCGEVQQTIKLIYVK